jgi:hypothetical protein
MHVCVVPEGPAGVRMQTIVGDKTVVEETIVADGAAHPLEDPNCRGTRRAEWSRDGQRLYSSGELTCERQTPRTVSGIAMLTPSAEWIDVQVVTAGNQENVRVRRYQRSRDVPADPTAIPADVAARAARAALGSRLTVEHVIEASGKVTPRTLEALLFEMKASFPMDSAKLIAMDDAGVADTVIDLMVAFSFPKKFEVKRSAVAASAGGFGFGGPGFSAEHGWPWFYDPYFSYNPYYSFLPYYSFFPYSYFSPFSYSYWNYGDGYFVGAAPGAIGGDGVSPAADRHGRVVNGGGYTQVVTRAPENNGQATQRIRSSGADASSGSGFSSGSSGSSGVSSGGYSSGGGGGDSGRTAVPR